jgi:DNA-binding NarL/FixJ family response regulator
MIYDWKEKKYVSNAQLKKMADNLINRKRIFPDENIDNYPENKDFIKSDKIRKQWFLNLGLKDICILLLREYGYNQTEIAEIIGLSQKTISNKLRGLKKCYTVFINGI